MYFETDISLGDAGFELNYKQLKSDEICGGTLYGGSGRHAFSRTIFFLTIKDFRKIAH
jgi:hypothetical protein